MKIVFISLLLSSLGLADDRTDSFGMCITRYDAKRVITYSDCPAGLRNENEVTISNHSKGPVWFGVRCFLFAEDPIQEFVIAPGESKDFPITCPDRNVR